MQGLFVLLCCVLVLIIPNPEIWGKGSNYFSCGDLKNTSFYTESIHAISPDINTGSKTMLHGTQVNGLML